MRSSAVSTVESISVISIAFTEGELPARKASWRISSALIPPGAAAGPGPDRYLSPELVAATDFVATGLVMSAIR